MPYRHFIIRFLKYGLIEAQILNATKIRVLPLQIIAPEIVPPEFEPTDYILPRIIPTFGTGRSTQLALVQYTQLTTFLFVVDRSDF